MEIPKATELEQKVFAIDNEKDFISIALEVYHFQFHNNPLYRDYCQALSRTPGNIKRFGDIPFLPISFFKSHRIRTTSFEPELVFKSSGTGGTSTSTHDVKKTALYEKSFNTAFRLFYGDPARFCILGLMPSYLQRGQSSLVFMVDRLIQAGRHPDSGFYLDDLDRLHHTLERLEARRQPTLLIGVTYALLDFAAAYPQPLRHTILMETGGMKGRRKEITREELYHTMGEAFALKEVHSEYGMTELLSQAYAINGRYQCPPWMRIQLRDETDPFGHVRPGRKPATGAINVTDLANLYSCSFIATEDIGRLYENGSFEVLGRMDGADMRGCSLMAV
ncbi:MAG TPA: acyl transferase [Flavisolibacter sp.]|nr:acyl transferase [Flavisolibacter sp.]